MTRYEVELATVLEAYERGRAQGIAEGETRARTRLIGRLKKFRRERSKLHDVGGPVLDEAIERCEATVDSITPEGVRHG